VPSANTPAEDRGAGGAAASPDSAGPRGMEVLLEGEHTKEPAAAAASTQRSNLIGVAAAGLESPNRGEGGDDTGAVRGESPEATTEVVAAEGGEGQGWLADAGAGLGGGAGSGGEGFPGRERGGGAHVTQCPRQDFTAGAGEDASGQGLVRASWGTAQDPLDGFCDGFGTETPPAPDSLAGFCDDFDAGSEPCKPLLSSQRYCRIVLLGLCMLPPATPQIHTLACQSGCNQVAATESSRNLGVCGHDIFTTACPEFSGTF
jgi:hypothetical protein